MNRRFGTRRFLCHEMERTQKINFKRVYAVFVGCTLIFKPLTGVFRLGLDFLFTEVEGSLS